MIPGAPPQKIFIRSIRLENFRIYESRKLEIDGEIVILVGRNGIGKSTIIEAISLLGSLKSFRQAADRDMIRFGSDQYYVELEYNSRLGPGKLGLGFGKRSAGDRSFERRMRINSESVQRISQFIGRIQTVVFAPDDINIIESGPSERRRFLDMLLSTIYPEYLAALQDYRKVLKMRAAYFARAGRQVDDRFLGSFDSELAKAGSVIQKFRSGFILEFQPIFNRYVELISNGLEQWKIQYIPSIPGGENREVCREVIGRSRNEDIRYRQTTRGVHRDRIIFSSDDRNNLDISRSGSQGQKRTVVLALKMSQFVFTRSHTSEKPVLLIDDVLNELDIDRRKKFIEFLSDAGQAFITATDISALQEFIDLKKNQTGIQIVRFEDPLMTEKVPG